jgi:hypothetical protein
MPAHHLPIGFVDLLLVQAYNHGVVSKLDGIGVVQTHAVVGEH